MSAYTSKDAIQNNLIAQAYNELRPDEELNCVAITQYCFKVGILYVDEMSTNTHYSAEE